MTLTRTFLSTLLLLVVGCGGGPRRPPDKPYIQPSAAKKPPAPPPRQDVPLDPALAQAARQEVNEALTHSDPIVRTHALESLRYTRPDAQTSQQVLTALRDKEPGVRFGAAMIAGELRLRDEPVYSALLKAADDPIPSVQVAARFALHKLGNKRRTNDLGKFAAHENPQVRRNVALVLGLLGEKSAINAILRPMRVDPDPIVRQQATEALWRLGDDEAVEPLVALTASGYPDYKIVGLLALAAPGRQAVREHVRGLLAGDDVHTEVALVAARAMGMLGSDEGYAIAQSGAASRDPQHRFLAAVALGAIGRSDAQDTLKKLMSDSEPNVQLAAASAVLELNKPRN